ncbi:SDR family NAD(P)-dependent oxidoreductase [Ilumatobacter nonamiensis]|uniref:SDR family NAD(P)-dependent oxidoreductase n=1 Tax=Ilumatobacter nonamiensis TaxID=467093 RepID=UPI00058BBF59|nr:SDR family NAD(P)-dependent oxidoreductase [Ilumatobacter nonamiensis]
MMNAFEQPQTILVLGGRSEIAHAIVTELASPALTTVVLAHRGGDVVTIDGLPDGVTVHCVAFDAIDHHTHEEFVAKVVAEHGDLDVVVQAFGQLGGDDVNTDPVAASELVEVNVVGAVSSGLAVAARLRAQGHGVLVVLSSVAGVRTRPSNFVYGATKAGQDAFATGLGHALVGSGARVMTVRPGFVRSAMTEGMDEAPFACDPSDVAEAVASGLRRRKSVVWAPGMLRGVFTVLRVLPGFLWRKLDR